MAARSRSGAPFDFVMLDEISNDAIVNNLKKLHGNNEMYSYIGNVLISCNPYTNISGLYSDATLKKVRFISKKKNIILENDFNGKFTIFIIKVCWKENV